PAENSAALIGTNARRSNISLPSLTRSSATVLSRTLRYIPANFSSVAGCTTTGMGFGAGTPPVHKRAVSRPSCVGLACAELHITATDIPFSGYRPIQVGAVAVDPPCDTSRKPSKVPTVSPAAKAIVLPKRPTAGVSSNLTTSQGPTLACGE